MSVSSDLKKSQILRVQNAKLKHQVRKSSQLICGGPKLVPWIHDGWHLQFDFGPGQSLGLFLLQLLLGEEGVGRRPDLFAQLGHPEHFGEVHARQSGQPRLDGGVEKEAGLGNGRVEQRIILATAANEKE